MLNRLKQILKLSKYDDSVLERLESLSDSIEAHPRPVAELVDEAYEENAQILMESSLKGEFLPDMTESEVLAYERNERLGWKKLKLPWRS